MSRLRTLDTAKRLAFQERQQGRVHRVLVERRDRKSGLLQGFSENYLPLRFPGGPGRLHRVVPVRFDEVRDGQPFGCIVEELLEEKGESR